MYFYRIFCVKHFFLTLNFIFMELFLDEATRSKLSNGNFKRVKDAFASTHPEVALVSLKDVPSGYQAGGTKMALSYLENPVDLNGFTGVIGSPTM